MFGAIYGDVIGSYYEVHSTKDYDFPFRQESTFTDDSVLTAAVCKAILLHPEEIRRSELKMRAWEYAVQFQQFYAWFPHAGYGGRFIRWASTHSTKMQDSFGNGAAMRAAPIGYAYDSIEQVLLQARASCLYTHHHPESVKGAQAAALTVWLARHGVDKETIRQEISTRFRYSLDFTVEDIRPEYQFDCHIALTVPPAIVCFLDSTDYESAVRNAVSLGGDADTLACIAGGFAEAYYKEIPTHIRKFCDLKIDSTIRSAIREFEEAYPL